MGDVAVVFGARGGIGAALVEALTDGGQYQVIGLCRPEFNLEDEASIARTVAAAVAQGPVRMAIDATGYLHDAEFGPEKRLEDLDADYLARCFARNVTGPALIMKHLLPVLPLEGRSVFATLSGRVGSIGDNRLGGWYGYRASKAALNQMVRTASVELARRRREAICVALHPGTVDTGLSAPFARRGLDVQTPGMAAARLLGVIDGLDAARTGGFFDHRGIEIPW